MASVEVAESYRPVKCFTSARPVTRKLISIYKHVVPTCRFFYFYLISRIPRRGILTKADGLHIVGPRYTAGGLRAGYLIVYLDSCMNSLQAIISKDQSEFLRRSGANLKEKIYKKTH